ncbi:hypothetical protein, partial [Pseudomonas coronafaciens]|uniref:hypothetical protein n=1 Tax=Pseudomonas coronafaciens TaxID=53409 RepID=UPI001C0F9CFC
KQGRQVEKNRLGNEDGANGLIFQRLPSSAPNAFAITNLPNCHAFPLIGSQVHVHDVPGTYVHPPFPNITAPKTTQKTLLSRLRGQSQPRTIFTIRDKELSIWSTLGFVLRKLGFTINCFIEGIHVFHFRLHSIIKPFVKISQRNSSHW